MLPERGGANTLIPQTLMEACPGVLLNTYRWYFISFLKQPSGVGAITIIPTSQMWNQKHQEVQKPLQVQRAGKWRSQGSTWTSDCTAHASINGTFKVEGRKVCVWGWGDRKRWAKADKNVPLNLTSIWFSCELHRSSHPSPLHTWMP